MTALIAATLIAASADSVNPIAISQQFVLQSMTKKAWHIWFFIAALALTNLAAGMLAYFGLITPLSMLVNKISAKYDVFLFAAEIATGLVLIFFAVLRAIKKRSAKKQDMQSPGSELKTARTLSPAGLFIIGVTATVCELTSALPYFAYLAILSRHPLNFLTVGGLLIIYNLIYCMPQIIMYVVYVRTRAGFERFYLFLKSRLEKVSVVLIPFLMAAAGVFLVVHSSAMLIK